MKNILPYILLIMSVLVAGCSGKTSSSNDDDRQKISLDTVAGIKEHVNRMAKEQNIGEIKINDIYKVKLYQDFCISSQDDNSIEISSRTVAEDPDRYRSFVKEFLMILSKNSVNERGADCYELSTDKGTFYYIDRMKNHEGTQLISEKDLDGVYLTHSERDKYLEKLKESAE